MTVKPTQVDRVDRSASRAAHPQEPIVRLKARNQELLEKADDERRRCRDWLLPFMQNNQAKFLTKNELRAAAMRDLKVSKNSFDFAWIDAIERTGRLDWHNPMRRRSWTKS